MVQNRNKLIELFIGNISNAIVHEILGKAINDDNVRNHYNIEQRVSFDKARSYREKINPVNKTLPDKDINQIKDKIIKKVKLELQSRASKGYKNINFGLIEIVVENMLGDMNVV